MQVFDRTQLKQAIRPHIQSIYQAQVREVDLYKTAFHHPYQEYTDS